MPKKPLRELQGFLKGKTNGRTRTIEEINDAIAEAGAAAGGGKTVIADTSIPLDAVED
jgi:hypothetical protein